jgi:membrane associated rhomboid family serine protease
MAANVKKILIAIVAVFIATPILDKFFGIDLVEWGNFSSKSFFLGLELWRVFTYPFLHGGIFHILFNALVLYSLGSDLEFRWGGKKFLLFFFVSSIGGAFAQSILWGVASVFFPESSFAGLGTDRIVGASGGLYGLFVAFGILQGNSIVHAFMLFPIKAKNFVLILLGVEIYSSIFQSNSGVAHLVHLGGLVSGFLMLKIWGPNLDGRGGWGGFGGKKSKADMSRAEVRSRLKLIVNKDDTRNSGGKYPSDWN